jgi:hypothetical protein
VKKKAAQKKSALAVIAGGFCMQVVGFVANGLLASQALAHSFALFISFGGALFLAGCIFLARAKGRSWTAGRLGLLYDAKLRLASLREPQRFLALR